MQKVLNGKFDNFNNYLTEKFKRLFEMQPSGARKNWLVIPDDKIEMDFQKAKDRVIEILESMESSECNTFGDDIAERIFHPDRFLQMRHQLNDGFGAILDRVYGSKQMGGIGKIPKIAWLILAFFARHDLIALMMNPLIMVPGILLAVIILYAYKSGHLSKMQGVWDLVGPIITGIFASGSGGGNESGTAPVETAAPPQS